MKYIHLGVCICIFLFVHNQILRADETVSDESLYTAEYINSTVSYVHSESLAGAAT